MLIFGPVQYKPSGEFVGQSSVLKLRNLRKLVLLPNSGVGFIINPKLVKCRYKIFHLKPQISSLKMKIRIDINLLMRKINLFENYKFCRIS